MKPRTRTFALVVTLLTCNFAAAEYPEKSLRLIVPFAPGGPSDASARVLSRSLSLSLKQHIIVDNRPGANGAVGSTALLNAAPNGYTLMWAVASMVSLPLMQKTEGFETFSQLSPVAQVGPFAFGMFIHPSAPAKSVADYVKTVSSAPRELTFAASTHSEYLAAAQFLKAANLRMTRIPYKGAAAALPDVIAGRVDMYMTPMGMTLPFVRDGRLRMLATLLPQRSPSVPEVPTMSEAGYPNVAVPSWQAIFAPTGTSNRLVQSLNESINRTLRERDVITQYDNLFLAISPCTPRDLAVIVARDIVTWTNFIRDHNILVE
jgi:tripartite-type tricarboxylate transporter receptor subunit TctC